MAEYSTLNICVANDYTDTKILRPQTDFIGETSSYQTQIECFKHTQFFLSKIWQHCPFIKIFVLLDFFLS